MSGDVAKAIWEKSVEPARREAAKWREGSLSSGMLYAGMIQPLGALRLALVGQVRVDDGGALAEISTEFVALEKNAPKV